MPRQISLPYNYKPRPYQVPALRELDAGKKRAVWVWHRRAGKDKTAINYAAKESQRRVGTYYYFLPTYNQGRKIIWDGMDKDGFKFIDHFPKELRDGDPNQTEMRIRMKNGSVFQVIGTDEIDRVVGTNPVGCVFSEYALQDPRAWDYIRPILAENDGWAIFPYTPRGRNHGYELYRMALDNPEWSVFRYSIDDTGIVSAADVQKERDSGMPEELIQQEFYCSFEGGMEGSYYSEAMDRAEAEKRIGDLPWDEKKPVDTWWDIGMGDATAIWFVQEYASRVHCIDFELWGGKSLPHYLKMLGQKPYVYGRNIVPHDFGRHEWGSGLTAEEVGSRLGYRFSIAPKLSIEDGINAVRMMLPHCWFDKARCRDGIDALKSYRRESLDPKYWHGSQPHYKDKPLHDWASDPADAFRTGAVGRREAVVPERVDRYRRRQGRQLTSWMAY